MRKLPALIVLQTLLLGLIPLNLMAEPQAGPVIKEFGPVFSVPDDSYNLKKGESYRIVMDIAKGPDNPAEVNRSIESAARFLNMHVRNGVAAENIKLAVVLHGSGARAALTDEAHEEKWATTNGSRELITALGNAGVDIYLCGQTAGYYGYKPEHLLPEVTMAVSAMTAHVRLQQEGYQAILF